MTASVGRQLTASRWERMGGWADGRLRVLVISYMSARQPVIVEEEAHIRLGMGRRKRRARRALVRGREQAIGYDRYRCELGV